MIEDNETKFYPTFIIIEQLGVSYRTLVNYRIELESKGLFLENVHIKHYSHGRMYSAKALVLFQELKAQKYLNRLKPIMKYHKNKNRRVKNYR